MQIKMGRDRGQKNKKKMWTSSTTGSQDKSQKENASTGGKGERLGFNRIGFWELGVNPPIHPIVRQRRKISHKEATN